MACPFFKECRRAFNSYFEKQALKIFSFVAGMNWKVINVYRGDNQIKKTKTKPVCRDRMVWYGLGAFDICLGALFLPQMLRPKWPCPQN